MAVKIVVDSASDITTEEGKKLGIEVVPIEIRFKEEEFLDGENLSHKVFYEKLIESDELPKTSQINPFRFEEIFDKITQKGDDVVCITLSSKLSGTYSNAKKIIDKYDGRVYVVDSLNACAGERILCQYAIKLASLGKSAKDIYDELERVKSKINVIAVVDTLKYLKKGGRISPLVAFAGEMFSIKPVIGVVKGEVKLLGKAMGSKKSNNMLNTMVAEKGGIDFDMPFAVIYSGLDKSMLNKYVEDSAHLWKDYTEKVPEYMIGCTIGTHVGPGAVGVAFFQK
jgi:DegV family protein with EDD domain